MGTKLFNEFIGISSNEWKEQIIKDLKGADYDKNLITDTIEGIKIEPFYSSEDLKEVKFLNADPGEFPFVRGNKISKNGHKIREDFIVENIEEGNQKALFLISKGINSLGFILNNKTLHKDDFFNLLKNIDITKIEINFSSHNNFETILEFLIEFINEYKINTEKVYGSLNFDPIGIKTITGNCYGDNECDFSNKLNMFIKLTHKILPNFKLITVNAQHFKNAGANSIQELAFGLSMGVEYITKCTDLGMKSEVISPKMVFNFGVSSNYFMEIAKIRAARMLWAKIIDAFHSNKKQSYNINIHSITSDYNKTAYDAHVNILRTTAESMSAILGGTDSLHVKPFNSAFDTSTEFSERIARNIQIILNEEAYFDKSVDAAGGSFYVESLTNSIAEQAWILFLEIEEYGGYMKAFDNGIIKAKVEETAHKRDLNIALKKEILLGTNQYPNKREQVKFKPNINPKVKDNALKIYRGAHAFEEIRQKTEHSAKIPKVFLLTIGHLNKRKARASFAENFFSCAGFEIIQNPGFESAEAGIQAALAEKADITVVCSSDEEYPDLVPVIFESLKGKSILVIAGYPTNSIDALKNFGIKHFIHLKSNIIDELSRFQSELGL